MLHKNCLYIYLYIIYVLVASPHFTVVKSPTFQPFLHVFCGIVLRVSYDLAGERCLFLKVGAPAGFDGQKQQG